MGTISFNKNLQGSAKPHEKIKGIATKKKACTQQEKNSEVQSSYSNYGMLAYDNSLNNHSEINYTKESTYNASNRDEHSVVLSSAITAINNSPKLSKQSDTIPQIILSIQACWLDKDRFERGKQKWIREITSLTIPSLDTNILANKFVNALFHFALHRNFLRRIGTPSNKLTSSLKIFLKEIGFVINKDIINSRIGGKYTGFTIKIPLINSRFKLPSDETKNLFDDDDRFIGISGWRKALTPDSFGIFTCERSYDYAYRYEGQWQEGKNYGMGTQQRFCYGNVETSILQNGDKVIYEIAIAPNSFIKERSYCEDKNESLIVCTLPNGDSFDVGRYDPSSMVFAQFGAMRYANGAKYTGYFSHLSSYFLSEEVSNRQGYGAYTTPKGMSYEGIWEAKQGINQHGNRNYNKYGSICSGFHIMPNGQAYKGVWEIDEDGEMNHLHHLVLTPDLTSKFETSKQRFETDKAFLVTQRKNFDEQKNKFYFPLLTRSLIAGISEDNNTYEAQVGSIITSYI